jgi:hypothetical protein
MPHAERTRNRGHHDRLGQRLSPDQQTSRDYFSDNKKGEAHNLAVKVAFGSRSVLYDLDGLDIYTAPTFVFVKLHSAGFQCKQRVIAADAHVGSRLVLGTALTDKDGACVHELGIADLETKSFTVAVAAVLDRALSFFMCHG